MLTQNRNNVMVSCIISLLWFFLAVVPASDSHAGIHNCSQNQLVDNDLIAINAVISSGNFTAKVRARKPFTSFSIGTTSQLDFFIDNDQNDDTGDDRPGAIRGTDLRISCDVGLVLSCSLYVLPTTFDGQEQKSNIIPSATLLEQNYVLQVSIPSFTYTAFDVFAFAHGNVPVFGGKTGNGDRCPETGIFDTATGTAKVRSPAAAVDAVIDDPSGGLLFGWGFQTFGDQYRIFVDYQSPIDVTSLNFQGLLELDTDRALPTGLVQTPFIIDSPFNEIPSWGWDVAIKINGGGQTGDDPTPISLDFGKQSDFIQAPTTAFPFFPFGEGYNDGRWYVKNGNQLVLEGSLSQLDTRQWRYLGNGSKIVSRVPTDGRVIGRLFTNLNDGTITDMIPKNDKAFDTGAKTELPAIQWVTDKMVSGMAPANDVERQWDLTQVDGQLVGKNLVVRGTLTRLDPSWRDTGLRVFLDTDLNSSTGTQISSFSGGQTIGADYVMWIGPRVAPVFLGYTTIFVKPDHSAEGHDNWVNIKFSDPKLAYSPAQVIVTIPLSAIGNPKNAVRLYFGTVLFTESIQDIAPTQPLTLINGTQKFQLSVNRLGTGKGTVTSSPAGINCGSDCLENYANGTIVTLKATQASGSTFTGWGGACSGKASCTVTLRQDQAVTATFNTVAGVPASIKVPASDADGKYTVSWTASATSGVTYILQEATNNTFTAGLRTAYTGTGLSTSITGRSTGKTYYYRVKATKTGYSASALRAGNNGCLVKFPVGVPASIKVPASDADGKYTVSWKASATSGVTYVLQEATNNTFNAGLRTAYTGTRLSASITGRSNGRTYYYRVKATKAGYSASAPRTGNNGCLVKFP